MLLGSKQECKKMFPVIGNGGFITAPLITKKGQPILDPLDSDFFKELAGRRPLDKKVIQWLLTLQHIGLNLNYTDRILVFYEKKENLSKLWDILALYASIDNDVGYCQGMRVIFVHL
ncbi:hypothetical protein Bca52824_035839 [Brassica carinata]|uniref:Rab-GAP TBC domain-containing protein n=1 Tax=Brassica carinata TaxID=52824 RepID=A0A8X7S458_BRACI|nr:hypothetical protein Bca52824_035839 [Brassica carinata]